MGLCNNHQRRGARRATIRDLRISKKETGSWQLLGDLWDEEVGQCISKSHILRECGNELQAEHALDKGPGHYASEFEDL